MKLGKNIIFVIFAVIMLFSFSAMAEEASGRVITLKQAQKMALENNYNMKNITETVNKARIQIWQAWSILLPNLSMNGSIVRNSDESVLSFPDFDYIMRTGDFQNAPLIETNITEKWVESFGFTANMTLLNARSFPLIKNAYQYRENTIKTARHQKNDLLFAVTSAYYQIQFTKESIIVAKESLENAEEFFRLSEARKNVGQATKIDCLRAESDVVNARKNLQNAEDSNRLAKTALSYMIGCDSTFEVEEPDTVVPVSEDLERLSQKALKDRLDLDVSRKQIDMAKRDRIDTWMKWVPTFDVTYKWDYSSTKGFSGQNDTWMLIFGAKWAILDGGMKIAESFQKSADIRMSQNAYEQQRLNVKEEVEKSLLEMQKRQRNIELSKKQVEVAKEAHKLVSRQYEMGMATSLDVSAAANQLSNARYGLVLEELQYDLAVLTLNKASGEYLPVIGQ